MRLNAYVIIGLILISFGLIYAGLMTTVQPYFLATFPYDGAIISQEDFVEVNAYFDGETVEVYNIYYIDDTLTAPILLSRASNVTLHQVYIPDFNGDGAVTDPEDADYIREYYDQTVPPAPKELDLNDDGVIDVHDMTKFGAYVDTKIYSAPVSWNPTPGNHTFTFKAETQLGEYTVSGVFTVTTLDVTPPPQPIPELPTAEVDAVPFVLVIIGSSLVVWGLFKRKPA